ncbi:MAG: DUF3035 domain-containing protein [Pseudomonadota bacterium]
MGNRRLQHGAAALGAALLISGCDSISGPFEAFTKKPTPDEFAVVSRAPLVMPGNDNLPEPKPGMPSPLDPNPQEDAIRALVGTSQPTQNWSETSQGEEVLLTSANAAAATSEIRVQLEQDAIESEQKKPYEPPSLSELLFGSSTDENIDPDDLLDPNSESRKLQTEGLNTPVDPFEDPPEVEQEREDVQAAYETGGGARPENKLYQPQPKF